MKTFAIKFAHQPTPKQVEICFERTNRPEVMDNDARNAKVLAIGAGSGD
jgi:hypothetical protein